MKKDFLTVAREGIFFSEGQRSTEWISVEVRGRTQRLPLRGHASVVTPRVILRFPVDSLGCRLSRGCVVAVVVSSQPSANLDAQRFNDPRSHVPSCPSLIVPPGCRRYLRVIFAICCCVGWLVSVSMCWITEGKEAGLWRGTVLDVTHSHAQALTTSRLSAPSSLCVPPFRPFSQKRTAV